MGTFKRFVRGGFRRMGFDIVPQGERGRTVLLDAFDKLLARPGIDVIIDVGANIGQFRDFLRGDVRYEGRIVSFEPNPEAFAACESRTEADPAWEVHPWALGDENANLTLHLLDGLSSFRGISAAGETMYGAYVFDGSVEVPVRRLDEVLADLGIDPQKERVLIKADTQGFDQQVFRGAPKAVRGAVALLTEMSQLPIYEDAVDFLDAIGELRNLGYDVAAMAPVTFHEDVVIEFDCMLINRRRVRELQQQS